MRYGAYHVWIRVKGLTEEERRAVLVILEKEKAEQLWDWDFNLEPDGSIWIAPLVKGDNPVSVPNRTSYELHLPGELKTCYSRILATERRDPWGSRRLSANDAVALAEGPLDPGQPRGGYTYPGSDFSGPARSC
jgi:hypothetical protein